MNAIMACLQLRTVGAPQPVEVEKWDKDSSSRVKVSVPSFKELCGKPLGLLIQMEIEKSSITGMERPTIFAPFSAESEKTASEILDPRCTTPAKLEKMVQQVMKRPVVDRRAKAAGHAQQGVQQQSGPMADGPDEYDQDIPF